MFFRQRWKDFRLAYQPLPDKGPDQRMILSPELSKHVWQPDVYFRNSKEARFHMVPTQNLLFGVSPDGSILLSARYCDNSIVVRERDLQGRDPSSILGGGFLL